jgi:hypothetical protein
MSSDGQPLRTEKLTLQTILQLGYATYERTHALPAYVRRAVWAILACRTALLGGHVQACPDGHGERVWYHHQERMRWSTACHQGLSCPGARCQPSGCLPGVRPAAPPQERVRGWGGPGDLRSPGGAVPTVLWQNCV